MSDTPKLEGLAMLRASFPPHQISKLPKATKTQTEAVKADFKKGVRCGVCGGWHHPDVVHLDYVGHAALTDRLLDTDPAWSWEPVSFTQDGLPAFDRSGGLWIRLTVCGVTRLGYGSADGKTGGDAVKEIIGDALRNAAMRFGAALDLWHKGDLHADEPAEAPVDGVTLAVTAFKTAIQLCDDRAELKAWKLANEAELSKIPGEAADDVTRAFTSRWNSFAPPTTRPQSQTAPRQRAAAEEVFA